MALGPWLLAALLLGVVAYINRQAVNHDAITYLQLAQHYLDGNVALAVSGLWSPLLVWLLSASLLAVQDPLLALRIAMVVSGIVFMAGAQALAAHLPTPALRCAMMVLSALFSALASGVQVTPDLLSAGIYAAGCACLVRARGDCGRMAWAGVLLGLGYLAKAVLLPVSVLVVLAVTGMTAAAKTVPQRRAILGGAVALCAMGLVGLPWIVTLSAKYGRVTVSNTHAHQHALAGPPGVREDLPTNRMFVVPERGRQSQFEDETIYPSATWSLFESRQYFGHFLKHLATRAPKVLEAARASDLLSIGLVLGLVLFIGYFVTRPNAMALGLFFPAMVLPMVAYLPNAATHIRLFFVCVPFYFLCALGGAQSIGVALAGSRLATWLISSVFVVLASSVGSLALEQSYRGWESDWFSRSQALAPEIRSMGVAGPVATAGVERDKHLAVYLSYVLGTPYHGSSDADGAVAILRSCARLVVARRDSRQDQAMRAAPERFDPLFVRSTAVRRSLADTELRLYAIKYGPEPTAESCLPMPPLWRWNAFRRDS